MKKQIFFSESYWIEEIQLSQINQFIVNEWNKEKLLKIYSETISNNLHMDTVFNNLEIIVEGASKLKSRRSFSFTKSRKYIFFIKKSTSSTPAPYFIPFFCFSWLKKKKNPRLFVILHSERWPRKHRFGEAGEQTGTKSPPPSPPHPFSLRKSKGRVIVRLIPQDKSLSDSRNPSN